MQHLAANVLLLAMLAIFSAQAWPQSAEDIDALNKQVVQLYGQGKYAEATAIAQQALTLAEQGLDKEHPNTLKSLVNLAVLYQDLGRFGEAEPLYKRVLEASERVLGTEHPNTLKSVAHLAALYQDLGRYGEAEPLYKHALEASERVLGKEHPDALRSVSSLAGLYHAQGRYGEAEPLAKRALEAQERVLGREHRDTLNSVNKLAGLYYAQGRYGEAEPLYKRDLDASERLLGREHPDTLGSVNNLALLYQNQGRYGEAEPLHKRVLDASERVLGKEHPDTLRCLNNLASLYQDQGRYGEAEPLYKRILDASERMLGKEHPDTLRSVNNLADFYRTVGRYGEAEPLVERALEARERVLGWEHRDTLDSVSNLAALYHAQGRYGEAEPLHKRALEARERVFGREHPDTLVSVNNLARLYFLQSDWSRAADFWRRSTTEIVGRTQRGTRDADQAVTGKKKSEAEQSAWHFWGLIKVVHRLALEGRGRDGAAAREMFLTAQWAINSEAAQSLAQMAARSASGDPRLAVLVRERQDLVAEWQKREALRNAALGEASGRRNAMAEAENIARLAAADGRIAEIGGKLAVEFPDYAALASPQPLSVEEVQAQLDANETLLLFIDTPAWKPTAEETFIWVVTKTDMRWVRSELGTAALTREVQALRCGLDAVAWTGSRCAELTGKSHTGALPPFDHGRAYKLYKGLFGQAEDLIRGKHLLLVPSGPLTQLPFQVLVTAAPKNDDHKSATWLARDNALTVLPAVSSLKALRRVAHPTAASKPMIGFGNPLLDGPDSRYAKRAQLARDKQKCPKTIFQQIAGLLELRGGVPALETYEGLANVSHIRAQAPLPETADELCAVARDINADAGEMRLGARATEHEVKALSSSGQLGQYRIVHFATHGAMAGELRRSSQPGLILTPPQEASDDDDGYLSGAEIAGLKLDADWVILSACNTAAGNTATADALSGLARAFIYAQARALLVSHWAVDSNATVKLVTTAISEMSRDRSVGRSEALRRAMLALIDNGAPHEAHPAYWAPFVIVGEGAR